MAFLDNKGLAHLWQHIVAVLGNKSDIDHTHSLVDLGAAPQSAGQYTVAGVGNEVDGSMVFSVTQPEITQQNGTSFIMIPDQDSNGAAKIQLNDNDSVNITDYDLFNTGSSKLISLVANKPYRLMYINNSWVATDHTPDKNFQSVIYANGSGTAYEATIAGVEYLFTGLSFIMVPNTTSTVSYPTLNVNSLGAKDIMRNTSNTGVISTGGSADWLRAGHPYRVTYDGGTWIVEGDVLYYADDISGTIQVSKGGTGANNAADARENLGVVNSSYSAGFRNCAVIGGYLGETSIFTSGMSTIEFLAAMPNYSRFQVIGNPDANFSDAPYSYCVYEFMKGSANYISGWAHQVGNSTTSLAHFCANSSTSGAWYRVGLTAIS